MTFDHFVRFRDSYFIFQGHIRSA